MHKSHGTWYSIHTVHSSPQDSIASEHARHGDVLQQGFVDSYANLTLKTAFMLKWLTAGEYHQNERIYHT